MTPHRGDEARARDERESQLCAEFWTWLDGERKRRLTEPSPEEKRAHPAHIALRALRAEVAS